MDKSLWTTVPSQMVSFLDQCFHEPGTNTLCQCPAISLSRVLLPSPVLYINTQIMAYSCYAVMWSAGQCKNDFTGSISMKAQHVVVKFEVIHWMVSCLMLVWLFAIWATKVQDGPGMCLAIMGPTLVANFCHGFSLLFTRRV